jgi:hypothetical protein
MRPLPAGWRSVERRGPDGAVDTEQRATPAGLLPLVPSEAEASRLGARYWRTVTRMSVGLARCRGDGDGVALRVLGRGPALLAFGPVELAVDENSLAWRAPVRGGLLARRPGGAFTIARRGPELSVALTGFVPRVGFLYPLQRPFHLATSRRFLRSLTAPHTTGA